MANIYTSIDQLIGNTPILQLKNIEKQFNLKANLFAKLEYFNPAGSVKDRVALSILNDLEKQGKLSKRNQGRKQTREIPSNGQVQALDNKELCEQ